MTGAGPSTWARRILTLTTAMVLLTLGAATALADPQPGSTRLTLQATTGTDFRVAASGVLTDQSGAPIPGAPLRASLNGEAVADGTTSGDGTYAIAFTLPETSRSGDQQLVILFAEFNGFNTTEAATTLTPAGPPPSPPAPPTPEDTRLDIILDVSIAPAIASAGDLVTIEGTITDQNDAPIRGARLNVLLGGTESPDSLVVSNEAGRFQTFAEIPPNTSPGPTDLVVSFAGDDSYTPGLKRFDVTVGDLPLGKDPSSTEEAAASSDTDPSATADASGSPTAGTTVPSPSPDTAEGPGPLSWFYVTLIAVGGVALLVAAALVFRGMYGHKPPTRLEDQDLDSLLQPDDAADPEEGALLSDSFSEVAPHTENPSLDSDGEPPGEPPAPRRSLD